LKPANDDQTQQDSPRRVVIVGGVAGGASCAARLRRLDESAEIIMIERGPYISFANCGLPYHIGGVIEERDSLLVQTPESFERRFGVEVRTLTEVTSIDPAAKTVAIRDLNTDDVSGLSYDALVLSPGASPFVPPIPGVDLSRVHALRTIPDMDRIIEACDETLPEHVTVVGAGFIGLEVAENLAHRGIGVTVVEMGEQVMPNLDPEMAAALADACARHKVEVRTETRVTAIEPDGDRLRVVTFEDSPLATDLVVMAVGVRPEVGLAAEANLELGQRGGIAVDATLRTSDPNIFAIGDAVEVVHRVTGRAGFMPLAGPANRQGRLVADVISGQDRHYEGPLGTSIIQVFDTVAACTGISERSACDLDIPHQVAWITGKSHASYYPGAESITLKAIFDPESGKLLGAQGIGRDGVDKRIDVLATAVAAGMTVAQLEQLDLAYAPPFSSAKDPVNHLGAVAQGMLRGDHPAISWHAFDALDDEHVLLDVRTPAEFEAGSIPGAVNIELDELRGRLDELSPGKPVVAYCKEGLRGYLATRILVQHGFKARNLLSGYRLWKLVNG
jgi:NADPH-dependent 2,4-dienoyl-CoA reductase/sulfur reductase-like enzyme/rhodanese-related sulfurtransferase